MAVWMWLVVVGCLVLRSNGKPTDSRPMQGPCVGMDCLHGVLMHNDEAQNGDHKAEDQYLRFKDKLDTKKPLDGPLNAADTYHAALMHDNNEEEAKHNSGKAILPEVNAKAGPRDLGAAMHEMMHGDGNVKKHAWDEAATGDQAVKKGPMDAEQMMHGVLMHGDSSHGQHVEEKTDQASNEKAGPQGGDDLMHGILMHGDVEEARKHASENAEDSKESANRIKGPDTDQLHGMLMHGDKELGQDHSKEHKKMSMEEVFDDIYQLLEMDLDEDLLKVINIKQILERQKAEYAEWIINNPQFQDETMMGSTYLSVSDALYDDIQYMKNRYLTVDPEGSSSEDDETGFANMAKKMPFSAEDASESLDRQNMDHKDDDMLHDLELVGSTEPLNARHKVHLALARSRSETTDDL